MDTIRSLYDTDFVRWAEDQAARLRAEATLRPNVAIDWAHLAEEIEDLGISLERALQSYLEVTLEHLLKLENSPDAYPRRKWRASADNSRYHAKKLLARSLSLKPRLPGLVEEAYLPAVRDAAAGLDQDPDDLPDAVPYTLDQILDEDWMPKNRFGLPAPKGRTAS